MASSSSGLVIVTMRNRSPHVATVLWVDGEREVEYGTIEPYSSKTQETFDNHVWRLHSDSGTAEITISSSTNKCELVLDAPEGTAPPAVDQPPAAAAAFYTQNVEVGCGGLRVRASDAVAAGAMLTAAEIAREMLRCSPASVVESLSAKECSVSIIGKDQVTSDIPEHREWALAASRPAEPSAPAAAAAEKARDESDSAAYAQRAAMARALQPRIEQLDALQLSVLVVGLVERGLLSDTALRDALGRVESASDGGGGTSGSGTEAMHVEAAPVPASDTSPPPPPPPSPPRAAAGKAPADARTADASSSTAGDGEATDEKPTSRKRDLSEIDRTTRGVGGGVVTSVGEENLLDVDADPSYREESVLCHEFGHTVMNLGLSEEARGLIRAAHADALKRRLYPPSCYMASNPDEYWAEGTQSWFDATVRADVNAGVNSRARLCAHDPALALLLRHAYGDGPWRYTDCVKEATREKWRKLQTDGARDAPKASTVPVAVEAPAEALAGGHAAATNDDEEERMMAIAIAQSLEVS